MTLRFRALLLVFVFNSSVFVALGFVLARSEADATRRAEELWTEDLVATIENTIAPEGFKVASILRWPSWRFIADAILVDDNLDEHSVTGTMYASGIHLNPVGVGLRPFGFDRDRALRAIRQAMQTGESVSVLEGRAVPIRVHDGVWGGLWYRGKQSQSVDFGAVLARVLPWFLFSTVLLTGATFLALRSLVLDPVARLAEGARRVRGGDFGARIEVTSRRDELADLVRSFNEMTGTVESFNQRLSDEVRAATEKARRAEAAAMRERRLAAMGELAAGIAHEINNPLGGLQNAVEDLKREDLRPERRAQYLDLLARGLARIGETVNRLRRFTPREAPHEPVELRAVIEDVLELVQHRAKRLGVTIAYEPEEGDLSVSGVRNDLGQAVLNLLVNALDALEEGGSTAPGGPRISIGVHADGGAAKLVVEDNGPGVPPELLDKVGDLFYTSKEVGRGTGLGLALVHTTMQRHGGRLHIESELGRYFRVELHFPPRAGAADRSEASEARR